MTTSYRVRIRTHLIIGIAAVVFFLPCAVGAFLLKQYLGVAIFAIFALMGLYVIMSAGSFEISDTSVTHRNLFGTFRMLWTEVRSVEVGLEGSIILHGEGKRFALTGPAYWSGKEKPQAFELLTKKMDQLDVIKYPSNVADYKIHKNVRTRADLP